MKEGINECAKQTKKKNKSQEHNGALDTPDATYKTDDGVDSQGSLDVLADVEDD